MRIQPGRRYRMKQKKNVQVILESVDMTTRKVIISGTRMPKKRSARSLKDFIMKYEECP